MMIRSVPILRRCWISRHLIKKGLIYGMGHAVYSVSDPRAEIFKRFVKQLAVEKKVMRQNMHCMKR